MARKCSVCKKKLTADDDEVCQTCAYIARRAAEAAAKAAARAKAAAAANPPKPRPRKPAPPKEK
jgi:type IV secretory pathway VirB9-like protein